MSHLVTRRQMLRTAILGVSSAALAACQPQVVEVTREVQKVVEKVVKETVMVAGTPQVVEKVVKETVVVQKASGYKLKLTFAGRTNPPPEKFKPYFMEKYPNYDINWEVGAGDIRPRLMAQITAGDAPDVFGTCCGDSAFFIQIGQTLNLQPFIDRDKWDTKDFHAQQFKTWKKDGSIHALPSYTGTYALYFNKDMFDAKGVAYPSLEWGKLTFDQYHEMLLKLADPKKDPPVFGVTGYCLAGGGSAWVTQIWLRGFGARMVNPDNWNECKLTTPEAIECLGTIQKMVHQEKVIGCGGEAQRWIGPNLFAGGRAAMLEMGSWGLNDVGNGAKFKWDVGGMWAKKGGPTTHVSVDCNEVWSKTKNPEESWTLIKELTSVEAETMQIEEKGTQPSRMSVLKTWIDQRQKALPAFANINLKAFSDAVTGGFGDQEEMFTQDTVAKNTILGPIMDRILLLNTAPAADIVKYAQLANRFLAGEVKVENIGAEMDKLK